jgi:hypothetical protein
MGWFRDDPRHEGYVVGLVEETVVLQGAAGEFRTTILRELSYHRDQQRDVPTDGLALAAIQVGCECGWRSPRFLAPLAARWFPHHVDLDGWSDDRARELWGRHYDEETHRPLTGTLAYAPEVRR